LEIDRRPEKKEIINHKTINMNYLKTSLLFGALLCLSISTFAQRPGGPRDGQQRGPQGPDLETLQKELGLSEAQVTTLSPILENTKKEMHALRTKEFASQEARRTATKAIMDKQKAAVNSVLTEDQIKKMEALQQKQRQKGRKKAPSKGDNGGS
jgi:hypothetical protein